MERKELEELIEKLNNGEISSLGCQPLTDNEIRGLASYIENNIEDYFNNEEFPDEESVLYDAIEPVQAQNDDWMFDDDDQTDIDSRY